MLRETLKKLVKCNICYSYVSSKWPESPSWREIAPRLHPNVRQICWWSGKKISVHNSWKHLFVDAISLGRQMDTQRSLEDPSAENMPTKWSLDQEKLYEWTANQGYGSNDKSVTQQLDNWRWCQWSTAKKSGSIEIFWVSSQFREPFSTTHCDGDPSFRSIESRPDLQGIPPIIHRVKIIMFPIYPMAINWVSNTELLSDVQPVTFPTFQHYHNLYAVISNINITIVITLASSNIWYIK